MSNRSQLNQRAVSGLIALLIVLLPVTTSAQFIPINQAKEQATATQEADLTSVLSQINQKGSSAATQIAAIFTDVANNKVTASTAETKSNTVIDKLKTQLNSILNTYTKKSPSGISLRQAYNAGQQVLDDNRRLIDEALDQAAIAKQQNPTQLNGKYLDYQNKIKAITAKALQSADDIVDGRGTKNTVTGLLDKLVSDTQKQADIATDSFLSVNPTLLASAVQRVKKQVLDDFSEQMATRYKAIADRGNNKALDLTEEEAAEIAAQKKEMDAIVARAVQTADQLMQQLAGSNLPTTSNQAGVNPLLEAKFKAEKQLKDVREDLVKRLDTINSRFKARTDMSQNAKDVLNDIVTAEKNSLTDTFTEYKTYLSAGDPTKQQYNKAKRSAQDEAAGCDSFLCDIGRVAATVGSGFLAKTTGVKLGAQTISNSIFQIDDPNPYARSKYQGTSGYTLLPGGVSATGTMQYNPSTCLTAVPESKRVAFIEKAQAADTTNREEIEAEGGTSTAATSSRTSEQVDPEQFFSALTQSSNNVSTVHDANGRLYGTYQEDTDSSSATNTKSASKKASTLQQIGQTIASSFDALNRGKSAAKINQGQYACNTRPNLSYSSAFGGAPVGQLLGYGTNSLYPNISSTGWQSNLRNGFQIASQQDPALAQILPLLASGNLTPGQYNQLAQYLGNNGFYTLGSDNPYWETPITNLFRNLCAPNFLINNQSMVNFCKTIWLPTSTAGPGGTPVFNPNDPLSVNGNLLSTSSDAYKYAIGVIQGVQKVVPNAASLGAATNKTSGCRALADGIANLNSAQAQITSNNEKSLINQAISSYQQIYNAASCSAVLSTK